MSRDGWLPPGVEYWDIPGNDSSLTEQVGEWSHRNFGLQAAWQPLLGVGEELGELHHAFLKKSQGIRAPKEGELDYDESMQDAIGDLVIYLADFCHVMGWDLEEIVWETWSQVKQRDWVTFPKNGLTE